MKNLFVFAAVTFSQNLFSPLIWPALAAFAIFCALSGAIYLINDLIDVDKDRQHPVKRYRPIASGSLPRRTAAAFAVALLLVSLGAAFCLSLRFGVVALAYGADDVDGTVVEEKIYHEAGATTPQRVAREELIQWIRDAGRIPVERDTLYNVVWSDETLETAGA